MPPKATLSLKKVNESKEKQDKDASQAARRTSLKEAESKVMGSAGAQQGRKKSISNDEPEREANTTKNPRKSNGSNEKKKFKPVRGRGNLEKLRVGLPPVEAFMKDLEFPAEGPSKVVMRIERLMGSEKIKLLDRNYMKTFLKRLEGEELDMWDFRSQVRKAKEHERYRQLAINGYMEPGPDMQSVYCHPLYRVNKILKRLNKFDPSNVLNPRGKRLPPITPIDPFLDDESGAAFKSYPGHEPVDAEPLSELGSRYYLYQELNGDIPDNYGMTDGTKEAYNDCEDGEEGEECEPKTDVLYAEKEWKEDQPSEPSKEEVKASKSTHDISIASNESDAALPPQATGEEDTGEGEDEDEDEEEEEDDALAQIRALELSYAESLKTLQQKYEIAEEVNLEFLWKPFQNKLVEEYFGNEENTVTQLYEIGDEIVGVFRREILVAEDACLQLSRAIDQYELANYGTKEG